jgi:hypothetical protein
MGTRFYVHGCFTVVYLNDFGIISDDGGADETGHDVILAVAVSPTGRLAALTDDSKRLVLFRCDSPWQCISTR